MGINNDKCHIITYTLKRFPLNFQYNGLGPLKRVQSTKDLSVTMTKNLNFSTHVTKTVNNAFKMLGMIKRESIHFLKSSTVRTLYLTLVRSLLEYGRSIWNPLKKISLKKLNGFKENLQNSIVTNLESFTIRTSMMKF